MKKLFQNLTKPQANKLRLAIVDFWDSFHWKLTDEKNTDNSIDNRGS